MQRTAQVSKEDGKAYQHMRIWVHMAKRRKNVCTGGTEAKYGKRPAASTHMK